MFRSRRDHGDAGQTGGHQVSQPALGEELSELPLGFFVNQMMRTAPDLGLECGFLACAEYYRNLG